MDIIKLEEHYGKPSEFALTFTMEAIKSEVVDFWEKLFII